MRTSPGRHRLGGALACAKQRFGAALTLGLLLGVEMQSAAMAQSAQPPQALQKPVPIPSTYAGADLALGERLIQEHRCVACHQQKVGGDGSAIYKPSGRINTLGFLRGMVEQCNTELKLGLFPEEVTSVAAVLNRDHYRLSR